MVWYYIKQIMNVFIRAIVRIFSFGERLIVPFNSAIAPLNGTINFTPHENILTIALINIHYLYTIKSLSLSNNGMSSILIEATDLNYWIKHPFEFSDPILKPEYTKIDQNFCKSNRDV